MKTSFIFVAVLSLVSLALAVPLHHLGFDHYDHNDEHNSRNQIIGNVDLRGSEPDRSNHQIVQNVGNDGGSHGGLLNNVLGGGIASDNERHIQIIQTSH
ncbi:hypothetical protein EC973_001790 [Apophysomyces ossiformis]|uniref:Uncharacterized protein n=1 Tax=Apophysomyces ossiformis TaxID=679940 RepID=A0A8H7BJ84_9FUNG|nr:hypothetical protein EC973_001790 [Apophysomyces ossiformis]